MKEQGTVTISTERYDELKAYESLFKDNKAICRTFTDGLYSAESWFIKDKESLLKR